MQAAEYADTSDNVSHAAGAFTVTISVRRIWRAAKGASEYHSKLHKRMLRIS